MILFDKNDIVQYVKEKYYYFKFKQACKKLQKEAPRIDDSWDPPIIEMLFELFRDDWD